MAGYKANLEWDTSLDKKKANHLNVAFGRLRTMIPTQPVDRKLSKIETLRLACRYISHLDGQLVSGDAGCCATGCFNNQSDQPLCIFCVTEQRKVLDGFRELCDNRTSSDVSTVSTR